MTPLVRSLLAAVFLFGCGSQSLAGSGGVREAAIAPSVGYFTWEEQSQQGRTLLRETAPLFGVGGQMDVDLFRGESDALTLRGKADFFGGEARYHGETTEADPSPIKTNVTYFGGREEADFGWAFRSPSLTLEPFGGIGFRWWLRSIHDAYTADGTRANGYDEFWRSFYSRTGIRARAPLSPDAELFFEGGAKYPFSTTSTVSNFSGGDLDLHPAARWSGFGEAGVRVGKVRAAFFYEGYRFAPSSPVPAGDYLVYQPTSSADIFGISVGYCFR